MAALLWVVRAWGSAPRAMASGLLGAWPVSALELRGRRILVAPAPTTDSSLASPGLAALGVIITQYDEGGGHDWGGRFLMPLVPVLAVFAAEGIRSFVDRVEGRSAEIATIALVVALVFGGADLRSRLPAELRGHPPAARRPGRRCPRRVRFAARAETGLGRLSGAASGWPCRHLRMAGWQRYATC